MACLDFRSDTLTLPTPAMMDALNAAKLGDAARGDDPATNELEAAAAEITGKEAALFTPSGTMANLAAILTHVTPGQEVIVEHKAHIYNSEAGGLSALAGAIARPVVGKDGILNPDDVCAAIRPERADHVAPTGLLCLENTLNSAGGTVLPPDHMSALYDVAQQAGLPVHLDGARMFNAGAALDLPVSDICRFTDSVMFALSKGLGAPVGSILAGPAEFIKKARKKARMLGGGMRQIGLVTAPALVALQDPYPRLRRDHAMATRLAEGLAAIDESLVRLETVQTNIVNCFIDAFAGTADGIVQDLSDNGVRANFAGTKIRFVTHAHIDEASVDGCLEAMKRVLKSKKKAA